MGTRTRIGIWVGLTVVLSVLAWEIGPFLAGGGIGDELDEPVAVVEVQEDEAKVQEADGDSDADRDRENEEFMAWMAEEAAIAQEAEAVDEGQDYVVQEVAVAEAEPVAFGGGGNSGGGMPRWQSIWADLNLTPEEEARMREGFSIAISRYMSMSPEEQAAERERMAQMRQRWEGMSDEEREAASQRIRDRFEDWRASGRVELPELSLD